MWPAMCERLIYLLEYKMVCQPHIYRAYSQKIVVITWSEPNEGITRIGFLQEIKILEQGTDQITGGIILKALLLPMKMQKEVWV